MSENNERERVIRELKDEIAELKRITTNLSEAATKRLDKQLSWVYALEGNRDGVWDWNAVTSEVFFSVRWKEMLGYRDDEIEHELSEWDKRIHPDDKVKVYADLNDHLEGRTSFYENEHRIQCKDGTYKWILDRGRILSWTDEGQPLRVVGTHTDITERKEAELLLAQQKEELIRANTALKDSEEKFRSLSEAAFEGILIIDKEVIVEANSKLAKMSGYEHKELIGLHVLDLIASSEKEKMRGRMLTNDEQPAESVAVKKDGTEIPIEMQSKIFDYKGKRVRVTAVRDLSAQKHAAEEIKTLQGILPICASCKKIRDDKGYWNQIEAYIKDRSEAEFSHSICPDCVNMLYPNLRKDPSSTS